MKLSISHIAWDPAENEHVAALLADIGVACIDVAPSKLFPSIADATVQQARRVRHWWQERGIAFAGMQSLFFGTSGLSIFGAASLQSATLQHLRHVFALADALSCRALTFGSPKQRDPGERAAADAWQQAREFFCRAAEAAHEAEVQLCLEANVAATGCRFLTHTAEAARMVAEVDHPGLRLQLDLGTCSANEEDLAELLDAHAPKVGHVHLSEPGLIPFAADNPAHAGYAAALHRHLGHSTYTVEMLTPSQPDRLQVLRAALTDASALYGQPW